MRHGAVGTLAAAVLLAGAAAAQDNDKACKLATADELQTALGTKVSGLANGSALGDIYICSGQTATSRVMLRLARGTPDPSGRKEAEGIAVAKKMGAQVDVKTFGPVTCSTMIPPKNLEEHGFNTTCSVVKNGQVAAVEVTAKTRAGMVSIEKLRAVAERIAGRM
jgi:hypothetical protein